MKNLSDVTGVLYDEENVVYFRNIYQSAFYVKNNAKIIDIFSDSKGKLVFVFDKNEHKKLIKLWMNNKENK